MTTSNKFILMLLLVSIVGGILISRHMNRPQPKDWYFNVITGKVVVVDSLKNDSVFAHSENSQKSVLEKESIFRIHYKKIKE